jgi:hypothetical protein
MGTVWSVDAVWKNVFTSFYGSIVALDESPLVEGLLYAGTDDGLVQVSEDGGETWRREESFPGVPEMTYVSDLTASLHAPDRVYATLNNHKSGDFSPYVLRSDDRGRTWTSMRGDLPDRHLAWSIVEDHEQADLLFAGTEFGLFFSRDGGGSWIELQGGVPTVAFRDLEIQRRENDLVAATFGRGFFILDDYSPLRHADGELLGSEAALFPVKDAWLYVPSMPLGWGEKASQGDGYFTAPNPPFGAVFTYYLKEGLSSRREARREEEKARQERGEPVFYPEWEALRAEDREQDPAVLLVVFDSEGNVVRRVEGPVEAGMHRVAWDLRYPAFEPTRFETEENPWGPPPSGPLAPPGEYSVRLAQRVDGQLTWLSEPQSFSSIPLAAGKLGAQDRQALADFQSEAGSLLRAVLAAVGWTEEAFEQLRYVRRSIDDTRGPESELAETARQIESALRDERVLLTGDRTVRSRREPVSPSIVQRIERVTGAQWGSTATPTGTHRRNFEIAREAFREVLGRLGELESRLEALSADLESAGAPWTPGRGLPEYE